MKKLIDKFIKMIRLDSKIKEEKNENKESDNFKIKRLTYTKRTDK